MGVGNEDIEHTFGTLVLEICRSFKRKEVSIDEIVLLLEQLSIFDNSTEVIHKAEKMEKLFQSFRNKWSWYNHSLLEDLINDFGDDQDKERFREYHSKFTSFLKNPLPMSQNEYSFGTSCGKGQKLLRIKVNENWDTTTLEQVSQIHHSVARILKIQLRDLYLTSVSKGCICLEFLVPESIAIPLRALQEEALMAVGVFRLECGENVFQVYYLTKLSTRNFTDCMFYPSVNFMSATSITYFSPLPICNFRILTTWDMQTDLKKTKVMRAALSQMVEVMLTNPAIHRYSCYRVLVAVSVATSFVSLCTLSGWKTC